jgi:hypothetical protein
LEQLVIWALATGLVTGVVGTAIVMYRRPRRVEQDLPAVPHPAEVIDDMARRVALLEERLDATEHELRKARNREVRPRNA